MTENNSYCTSQVPWIKFLDLEQKNDIALEAGLSMVGNHFRNFCLQTFKFKVSERELWLYIVMKGLAGNFLSGDQCKFNYESEQDLKKTRTQV